MHAGASFLSWRPHVTSVRLRTRPASARVALLRAIALRTLEWLHSKGRPGSLPHAQSAWREFW